MKIRQNEIYFYILLLISFGIARFVHPHILAQQDESNSRFHFFAPPPEIKQFVFGYDDLFADMLWVRLQQDFGVCEQTHSTTNTRTGLNRTPDCSKGWNYQILNTILELAPRWRQPATLGPVLLSVIVDDIDGATLLYKKAIANFPQDWRILYSAGYHFLYETKEKELAAEYYYRAAQNGAPQWLFSLAAKLYSESGREKYAIYLLRNALRSLPEGRIREKTTERLKEIEAKVNLAKEPETSK